MEWFEIKHTEGIDTPSLALYKERVETNIDHFINMCDDITRLRPHVKTNKIAEVCSLMLAKGITRFKCATIAELEMLCRIRAPEVLLAYPLVGSNISHFIHLQQKFPATHLAFLVDDSRSIAMLDTVFGEAGITGSVFIDVNVGMNRTGCQPRQIIPLARAITATGHLQLEGLHAYDGHIHDGTQETRKQVSRQATAPLMPAMAQLEKEHPTSLQLVIGGSPTFAFYESNPRVQLSPGTFVFWDYGYKKHYPELPFEYAAVVLARVISRIDAHTICMDMGTKAIACEMPQPRMYFLNIPDAEIVLQSEEHLVIRVKDADHYPVGMMVYAVPLHICPTVALYDRANIIENHTVTGYWNVVARKRFLSV